VIEDAPDGSEDERAASGGEADEEEQPDL
jgi:hypothetical protein